MSNLKKASNLTKYCLNPKTAGVVGKGIGEGGGGGVGVNLWFIEKCVF